MPEVNDLSANHTVPAESDTPARSDTITYWAQAWAEFFSSDAAMSDNEVPRPGDNLRSTPSNIEGKPPK